MIVTDLHIVRSKFCPPAMYHVNYGQPKPYSSLDSHPDSPYIVYFQMQYRRWIRLIPTD